MQLLWLTAAGKGTSSVYIVSNITSFIQLKLSGFYTTMANTVHSSTLSGQVQEAQTRLACKRTAASVSLSPATAHRLYQQQTITIQYDHKLIELLPSLRAVGLLCLEAFEAGSCTVFRSFMEGQRASLPRPPHHRRDLIGWSEASTLVTAFFTRGRCPHLISTQNAPFSPLPHFISEGVINPGEPVHWWRHVSTLRICIYIRPLGEVQITILIPQEGS